jgi:hypothetical protein
LALVAAAGVVGVPAARAEEPAKLDVVEEMAGALGYADSHAPGFWEALTQIRADQLVALEQKRDAERAEQAKQVVADASKYGRRLEETQGPITKFTEFIPPASGDIAGDESFVRVGIEWLRPDGTVEVTTTYYRGVTQLGVVTSVKKDGVETVKTVFEYEKDSIDVKPGDTRPVPPPGSSAAGRKPHTVDPKADGSLGRASGNQSDAPAEVAHTGGTPSQETVVRDKVEQADGGSRVELEPIKLPDGRVFKPFDEVKPGAPESPFRTGYIVESPDFDGALVQITAYFDKDGKLQGVVGEVLKDGLATTVTVNEFKPGSLGGLKAGDTRPVDPSGGKKPSTWDPPKPPSGSGSGAKSGGTQSSGGAPQNGSDPGTKDGRPHSEPKDSSPSDDAPAGDPPKQDPGGDNGWHKLDDQHHESKDKDGSSYQVDTYQQGNGAKDDDTVYKDVATYTDSDGKTTTTTTCYSSKGSQDCPAGLTDEPTCGSSCDHLAVFLWLVGGCAGTECGTPPVAGPERHCASDNHSETTSAGGGGYRPAESSGVNAAPHCTAGSRPGGPVDSGNPNDPNAPESLDPGQFVDPRNDGVTDPADPGEGENGPAPVALFNEGGTKPDLGGELRDPVAPWIEASGPSGDGPPRTGDADRIHTP